MMALETLGRVVGALALVGFGAAGLVGCGGDDDSSSTTRQVAVSTTAAATTAPPTQPTDPPSAAESASIAPAATQPTPTQAPIEPAATPTEPDDGSDEAQPELTIAGINALVDPDGEAESFDLMAWGDVDGDGDEDAVVMLVSCGASCGSDLMLILDDNGTPTVSPATFGPWYVSSGAAQSTATSVSISGSTVNVVATGLCADIPVSDIDEPGLCNVTTERTATYQYDGNALQGVTIDPSPVQP